MSTGTSVRDNPELHRYEIVEDGELGGFMEYRLHGSVVDIVHTEILDGYEGHGLASNLVRAVLDDARRQGRQIRPFCPFARSYIAKHPEYWDLVPADQWARFEIGSPTDSG
jgi:predicted GNAT family acetyltransferase